MPIETIADVPWYTPGDDPERAILWAARRMERLERQEWKHRKNMANFLRRLDSKPELVRPPR